MAESISSCHIIPIPSTLPAKEVQWLLPKQVTATSVGSIGLRPRARMREVWLCPAGERPFSAQLLADARRGKFDVVMVWAFDRIARSTRHFLEVLDELNHLTVEFVSFRENVDTGDPLGRAIVVIIGAIAELERNLIVERVRAGMRRAKLEGRRIGRAPLEANRLRVAPRP